MSSVRAAGVSSGHSSHYHQGGNWMESLRRYPPPKTQKSRRLNKKKHATAVSGSRQSHLMTPSMTLLKITTRNNQYTENKRPIKIFEGTLEEALTHRIPDDFFNDNVPVSRKGSGDDVQVRHGGAAERSQAGGTCHEVAFIGACLDSRPELIEMKKITKNKWLIQLHDPKRGPFVVGIRTVPEGEALARTVSYSTRDDDSRGRLEGGTQARVIEHALRLYNGGGDAALDPIEEEVQGAIALVAGVTCALDDSTIEPPLSVGRRPSQVMTLLTGKEVFSYNLSLSGSGSPISIGSDVERDQTKSGSISSGSDESIGDQSRDSNIGSDEAEGYRTSSDSSFSIEPTQKLRIGDVGVLTFVFESGNGHAVSIRQRKDCILEVRDQQPRDLNAPYMAIDEYLSSVDEKYGDTYVHTSLQVHFVLAT